MSRYYSKRNKLKVWRKSYGKVFLTRRAFKIANAVVMSAQSAAHISAINSAHGGTVLKALATADATIKLAQSVNSLDFNKGFITKGK